MRYGRAVEDGFLPVMSVDTEEEARALIVATCPLGYNGDYYAPELAREQTIENLEAFGDRLERAYQEMKERVHGRVQNKLD